MSKITNDGVTRSGTGCFITGHPYGNSGRQRVKCDYGQIIRHRTWPGAKL